MFGLPPIAIYAVIAAALIASAWGGLAWHASVNYTRGYDKAEAECMEANKERFERDVFKRGVASEGKESDRVRIETVYDTIEVAVDRIVDRPVYLDRCFDDAGLRCANAALVGRADSCKPDGAMPGAEAVDGQLGQGGAAQAGGSLEALPPVPVVAPAAR